jgi:hypothetical protein
MDRVAQGALAAVGLLRHDIGTSAHGERQERAFKQGVLAALAPRA